MLVSKHPDAYLIHRNAYIDTVLYNAYCCGCLCPHEEQRDEKLQAEAADRSVSATCVGVQAIALQIIAKIIIKSTIQ